VRQSGDARSAERSRLQIADDLGYAGTNWLKGEA
jgi:hypothetical protein